LDFGGCTEAPGCTDTGAGLRAVTDVLKNMLPSNGNKRAPRDGFKTRDVEELRRFAPLLADMPIYALACEVVHAELKRREEKRQRKVAMN